MLWENIFYSSCWTIAFLIIWFKTDWILHYCQLFNVFKNFTNDMLVFIVKKGNLYFPDYMYEKIIESSNNRLLTFFGKLLNCPLCVGVWLSGIFSFLFGLGYPGIAPTYVISMFIYYQIKKEI